MSKATIIAAAGASAVAALASTGSPAFADAPHCLHQVNPYVACTNSFKAKTVSPKRTHREHVYTIELTNATVASSLHQPHLRKR